VVRCSPPFWPPAPPCPVPWVRSLKSNGRAPCRCSNRAATCLSTAAATQAPHGTAARRPCSCPLPRPLTTPGRRGLARALAHVWAPAGAGAHNPKPYPPPFNTLHCSPAARRGAMRAARPAFFAVLAPQPLAGRRAAPPNKGGRATHRTALTPAGRVTGAAPLAPSGPGFVPFLRPSNRPRSWRPHRPPAPLNPCWGASQRRSPARLAWNRRLCFSPAASVCTAAGPRPGGALHWGPGPRGPLPPGKILLPLLTNVRPPPPHPAAQPNHAPALGPPLARETQPRGARHAPPARLRRRRPCRR
jgi:hypothetical protein